MLEIDNENDDAKWEKNYEENEENRDEMFYAVRDSFDRLSLDLGGDFFMSATSDYIKKFMNSSNWIEVHAAYTAMAFMSEGCKDSFSKNLKEFLQFISTGLTHKHPRVRYAALFAFGCGRNPQFGVVDMQKVEQESDVFKNATKELQDKGKNMEEEFKQETQGKSEEEQKQIYTKKNNEMMTARAQAQNKVKASFEAAVSEVAKAKNLSAVLIKEAVPQGGVDVTEDVIKAMK